MRILITASLLIVFTCGYSTVSYGEIYKWTDAQGNTHFGDKPPRNVKKKQIDLKINTYKSVTVSPSSTVTSSSHGTPNTNRSVAVSKQVVMYTTQSCGVCTRAKRYFRSKNIPFTEKDVEKSKQAYREFQQLNGRGVPIILIGNQRMNGFSARRFEQIYY